MTEILAKKVGRKPIGDRSLSEQIAFRLDPLDLAVLQAQAQQERRTVAQLVRLVVMDYCREHKQS